MKTVVKAIILVPIALLAILFAVANRQISTISLDPFNSETPALALSAPLFLVILLMVMLGVLIGGIAAWLAQAHVRSEARHAKADAERHRRDLQETRLELDLVHRQQAAASPRQTALVHREVA
ncbi:LapA family protein [Lichenifustis flavocetrariae]|uniref:LapA family protein n=1 Tax=Lichenifustis flavocetrariae TaxID=2949735 RepID=A0AA41YY59_9HYPH|nr:LapA family protein [Lichenifustis flavocetrariae]MCW6507058.1 LapA family protein [Lichenifustis flavocetrariae]